MGAERTPRPTDQQLIATTRRVRRSLLGTFGELGDHEWAQLSLCTGWTIKDVAAHLVVATRADSAEVNRLMVRTFGSFDRAMDLAARNKRVRPVTQVLDELRGQIEQVNPIPVLKYISPTVDIGAHCLDVCVPLDRPIPISPDDWHVVLSAATNPTMMRFFKRRIPVGVRLATLDGSWTSASKGRVSYSEPIRASEPAILAALTGRPVLRVDPSATDLYRLMSAR